MDISNYSSNHSSTMHQSHRRYIPTGKENIYFLSELNSPVTVRLYNDDNSETDTLSSGEIGDQSRIVLGDITEMFVDADSGSVSDVVDVIERSESQVSSSRGDMLHNSKVNKKVVSQNSHFLAQNFKNYSSVPSKQSAQSRTLRA